MRTSRHTIKLPALLRALVLATLALVLSAAQAGAAWAAGPTPSYRLPKKLPCNYEPQYTAAARSGFFFLPEVDPADVIAVLRPSPSSVVTPGSLLTYEITLRNIGRGTAYSGNITMPFDASQITPAGGALDGAAGDWVRSTDDGKLVVAFGEVGAGQERTLRVTFLVSQTIAAGATIPMRATVHWGDACDGDFSLSNYAPVTAGAASASADTVVMSVSPASAAAGVERTFASDRFQPDEKVAAWLNTPTGVMKIGLVGAADADGDLVLHYTPAGMAPGSYQLVVEGQRSGLMAVVSFTITA